MAKRKSSGIPWDVHEWRASMCDVIEYRVSCINPRLQQPYQLTFTVYNRDNGQTDFTAIAQTKVPDDIRGWWHTETVYYDNGITKNWPEKLADMEGWLFRTLEAPEYISYDDYFDWADNHPIKKVRRMSSDYGIYVIPRDGSPSGWFDQAYGSITPKNSYAIRFKDPNEARATADRLGRANKDFKFEVRQMGPLDE